jgi:hypothetical protein
MQRANQQMGVLLIYIAERMIALEKAEKDNEQEQDDAKKIDIHDYDHPPRIFKDFLLLCHQIDCTEDSEDTIKESDPFMFLVKCLFGQAHGLKQWRNTKCFQRTSDILTVLDEAFVLLAIENSWDAIQKEMEEKDDEEERNKKDGKEEEEGQGKEEQEKSQDHEQGSA